jgi:hypothetical protein
MLTTLRAAGAADLDVERKNAAKPKTANKSSAMMRLRRRITILAQTQTCLSPATFGLTGKFMFNIKPANAISQVDVWSSRKPRSGWHICKKERNPSIFYFFGGARSGLEAPARALAGQEEKIFGPNKKFQKSC